MLRRRRDFFNDLLKPSRKNNLDAVRHHLFYLAPRSDINFSR